MAVIEIPMPPPGLTLLQQEVLDADSSAVEALAAKYIDSRSDLVHTPRWGSSTVSPMRLRRTTTGHRCTTLRGSDSVLNLYRKGLDRHPAQYGKWGR